MFSFLKRTVLPLLLFPISVWSQVADVALSAPSPKPTYFSKGVEYSFEYTVTNSKNVPIVIQSTKDVFSNGCAISNFTQSPILPGKQGKITLKCKWNQKTDSPSFLSQSVPITLFPAGEFKVKVEGHLFDPESYSLKQDACGNKRKAKCQDMFPRKKLKLCFVGSNMEDEWRTNITPFCGSSFKRIVVKSQKEIAKVLDDTLEKSCDLLDTVAIYDHGSPGTQHLDNSDLNVQTLFGGGKYSCMLSPTPRIIFGGCQIGTTCEGRLFMYEAARSLSSKDEVTVLATNDYGSNLTSGWTSRTGSVNGVDLVLHSKPTVDTWDFEGLATGGKKPKSLASMCGDSCKSQMKNLLEIQDKLKNHCSNKAFSAIHLPQIDFHLRLNLKPCVEAANKAVFAEDFMNYYYDHHVDKANYPRSTLLRQLTRNGYEHRRAEEYNGMCGEPCK